MHTRARELGAQQYALIHVRLGFDQRPNKSNPTAQMGTINASKFGGLNLSPQDGKMVGISARAIICWSVWR